MTIPRRGLLRAVRDLSCLLPCLAGPTLALSLATGAMLSTGTALAAVTRSHPHHPSATALPVSSFAETGTAHAAKKRKGGNVRAGSRPSSAPRGGPAVRTGKTGKGRHGHAPQPEPADDPIPMYRTSHRAGHPSSRDERASLQEELASEPHGHRHSGRPGQQPILVDNVGRSISQARFRAMRSKAPTLRWTNSAHDVAHRHAMPTTARFAVVPKNAAEMTSNTDVDGRALLSQEVPFAAATIGSAVVMTANTPRPQPAPVAVPSQVVQGFGAEVALAPSDAGTRPGGTRRRDHPLSASALPGMASAPTLEERDAITEAAVGPALLPDLYDRNGRLVMPAPLRGSRQILVHQNTMANNDGLDRIHDDGDLDRLRAEGSLVNFPVSSSLRLNEDLPWNRRCARPWTVLFTTEIARDFYDRFHQPLQVNSAVRTVNYQARLQRINGNAAATDGDAASPHLTGQAIDLGKRGMSSAQLAWMRAYLLPLMSGGKIDVEEEFQQACFHISVYRRYAGNRTPVHELAQVRSSSAAAEEPQPNP